MACVIRRIRWWFFPRRMVPQQRLQSRDTAEADTTKVDISHVDITNGGSLTPEQPQEAETVVTSETTTDTAGTSKAVETCTADEDLLIEPFELFGLPPEIRDNIYEHILPAGVNFAFLSPVMFRDFRGMSKMAIKPYPCGLDIHNNGKGGGTLSKLQSASPRLGIEAATSLSSRNARAIATLDACIPQTNPTWARGFHPDRITPRLLELVASSRFIFAGFGHNTANTLRGLDDRICANIKSIFLTTYLALTRFPGNHQWERLPGSSEPMSVLERLFASQLPALEKVAVELFVGQCRDLTALSIMLDWFDTGKIRELELVFPRSNHPWTNPTEDDCYEILYKYASSSSRDPSLCWQVERVSDEELDARGRWRFWYCYNLAEPWDSSRLVEWKVFRLVREVRGEEGADDKDALRERTEEEQEFFSGFTAENLLITETRTGAG
ncbi:hypothetical protein TWF696_008703 [Orbilia brochopaga]|uniref:Uncharacterized protein n=1 Tax=Orbilia brochopaga TaxID=3140254 RepID=A0AAV9UGY4_9PEZI